MAKSVVLKGRTYSIPEQGDVGWGSLSDLIERITIEVSTLLESELPQPQPLRRRVRTVTTTPMLLLATDDVVLVDSVAASAINLPDPSSIESGKIITIKDQSGLALTNTISIFAFGGATIDDALSYTVNENYGDASFVFDGVNWSRIQSLDETYENATLPVGSIISLTNHLTGSWNAPSSGAVKRGLMRCDGSSIPAGQTLSGTLPDLTDARFLRGATTSGGSGNATDLSHTHTLAHTHGLTSSLGTLNFSHDHGSTGSSLGTLDFSHTHGGTTGTQKANFTTALSTTSGSATFNKTVMNSNQQSHAHTYGIRQVAGYWGAIGELSEDVHVQLLSYNTSNVGTWTNSGGTNFGTYNFNSGAGAGRTARSGTYMRETYVPTSYAAIAWESSTVTTTFTNPIILTTTLDANQTPHSHSISSATLTSNLSHTHTTASATLTSDLSHTHITETQSTDTTSVSLAALEVTPKYFDVIYLMRVK